MSRDLIDDVTNRRAIGTFLYRAPIAHKPINRSVSEIFSSIIVADKQTHAMQREFIDGSM